MIAHQRETESRASGPAAIVGGAAANEPIEDDGALFEGHAGPRVVDVDRELAELVVETHRGGAAGVVASVVDQVRHDPLKAATVHGDEGILERRGDVDGRLAESVAARSRAHRLAHELDGGHGLDHEGDRVGVAASHFEQVFDQRLENRQVGRQEIQALLGDGRELGPVLLEDRSRCGERGERRAELVADVTGETRVALHPVDELADHLVERVSELLHLQVGASDLQARRQVAVGDGRRRHRDPLEGTYGAAGHPQPARDADQGGGERPEAEHEHQVAQRVFERIERVDLEELRLDGRYRNAHDEDDAPVHVENLGRRIAGCDLRDDVLRHVVGRGASTA